MITNVENSSADQDVLFNEIMPKRPIFDECRSVLQCGARIGTGWQEIFRGFQRNGFMSFEILEIFKPNVEWLRKQKAWPCSVHEGDIRKIDEVNTLMDKTFDVVTFFHGWEHCTRNETYESLPKILSMCKVHIVGMPWGEWIQGSIKGNPHEVHLTHWQAEELEEMGFDVWTFNDPAKKPGPNNENVMFGVLYEEDFRKTTEVCRRKILEQSKEN